MTAAHVKACTVCGSVHSTFLFKKSADGRGQGSISIHRCESCLGIYLGEYSAEYEPGLYEYYQQYEGKSREVLFNNLTAKSYEKVLNLFSRHTSGKEILDVGCGTGGFVDAGIRTGWTIDGIELAAIAVKIARDLDLPVRELDFFSDQIRPESYDIVTLFEVLEHLPDPISFLKRSEAVVKPGGLIYLTTPNFNALDRRILGTEWPAIHREHLTYFTPKALLNAIHGNTRLKVVHHETRNISIAALQQIKARLLFQKNPASSNVLGGQSGDAREAIERSRALTALKTAINSILNVTGAGNTIVMLLKKEA